MNIDLGELDLAEVDRRARERRAREGGTEKAMLPAAKVFEVPTPAPSMPRCCSCRRHRPSASFVDGSSKCADCRDEDAKAQAAAAREIEARAKKIPPAYRGDPAWSRLRPPPFLPEDAVRMGLEWLASRAPRLSIFGEQTGSGKSTLAAFVALVDIHEGRGWEWVHASDLVPDHEVPDDAKEAARIVATAPRVIVDGIGKEFRGHDPKSGWAARKKEWVHRLFYRAHESRKQRFIFTFDMGVDRVQAMYDDASILRRVAPDDGKTVIVLHRQEKLRIARGR